MSLVLCGLSPHPPLLVPDIGGESLEQVRDTQAALQSLCRTVVERKPDTVVIICPHGPVRVDAISMLAAARFEASFTGFEKRYVLRGDLDLADRIRAEAGRVGLPVFTYQTFDSHRFYFSRGLDHATMVPLYYLKEAGLDCELVCLSIAAWSHRDHYVFGHALQAAIESTDRRVVLLASGDLSHRLLPTAPAGYEPRGIEFDRRIVDDLGRCDAVDVLSLDDAFIERIGECGLRPLSAVLGAMHGRVSSGRVLSYEGPFGVGYCVAVFEPGGPAVAEVPAAAAATMAEADPAAILHLARTAVETFVRTGATPTVLADNLPEALRQRAAAFVCLKSDGGLRGCIGTTQATRATLAEELIQNAISACSRDPRFRPVTPQELAGLRYSVDVLEPPEPAGSVADLDPLRYGVIVRNGPRSGVLLPNLAGVESAHHQVEIARQKAGIAPDEPVELMRFRVHRFEQKD